MTMDKVERARESEDVLRADLQAARIELDRAQDAYMKAGVSQDSHEYEDVLRLSRRVRLLKAALDPLAKRGSVRAEIERQCSIGAGECKYDNETGLLSVHADLDIATLERKFAALSEGKDGKGEVVYFPPELDRALAEIDWPKSDGSLLMDAALFASRVAVLNGDPRLAGQAEQLQRRLRAALSTPKADQIDGEALREALEQIAFVGPNGTQAKNAKACRAIARAALSTIEREPPGFGFSPNDKVETDFGPGVFLGWGHSGAMMVRIGSEKYPMDPTVVRKAAG